MSTYSLSQDEAEKLLSMLKRSLEAAVKFPNLGNKTIFDVEGIESNDIFKIQIYRGNKNPKKYNIGALIFKYNVPLLELHINPTNIHQNPDGTKITGSHWHVYSEEYGRGKAFPAEYIESENFVQNTIAFLEKFNVVEKPKVELDQNQTLF